MGVKLVIELCFINTIEALTNLIVKQIQSEKDYIVKVIRGFLVESNL